MFCTQFQNFIIFPILVLIVSVVMLAISITLSEDRLMFGIALAVILIGFPIHFIFNHWKFQIPGFGKGQFEISLQSIWHIYHSYLSCCICNMKQPSGIY